MFPFLFLYSFSLVVSEESLVTTPGKWENKRKKKNLRKERENKHEKQVKKVFWEGTGGGGIVRIRKILKKTKKSL